MIEFETFYRSKRVLVTGHTGFKGAWLCEWLLLLGAEIHGYALDPQPHEVLFDQLGLSSRIASDTRGDIRDRKKVREWVCDLRPDAVFHLAAQPLVRLSYELPVETYEVNVMGTIHVLDALRCLANAGTARTAAVLITTDKCYENREWLHAYREDDEMGGHDPYSSSKGAAELAIAAYRRSYFSPAPYPRILVASARAGNVIGGGDWAKDRIVPDCIRALQAAEPIRVRNKGATRPWQHVLEPLSGYLLLGKRLLDVIGTEPDEETHHMPRDREDLTSSDSNPTHAQAARLASAFNFGPDLISNRTVAELVEEVLKHWPGSWLDNREPDAPHEASKLNLATDKAFHVLGWRPRWNFEETIRRTINWYRRSLSGADDISALTRTDISDYQCSIWSRIPAAQFTRAR
jgi:CDP-glucose 4,6-dehydratase